MNNKIALVGNPNCGKTTLFNALTGSNQYVGNWPGVTVEYKEGKLLGNKDITITDLPGIYSLSPYTLEEVVSRNYLVEEEPAAIINIVDGSNLERNLYLSTQILELGIPTIIAINMMDVVEKRGDTIDIDVLSNEIGCKVIEISALRNVGIDKVKEAAVEIVNSKKEVKSQKIFEGILEEKLGKIEKALPDTVHKEHTRWYAVKIFERDKKVLEEVPMTEEFEKYIKAVEDAFDDDSEGVITGERYAYIEKVIAKCHTKNRVDGLTTSDKVDKIVTNRYLGLPIFAIVMFFVYYISINSVGAVVTDFANDVFFGQWVGPGVSNFLESIGTAQWLQGLLVEGIIGGVGAVLGFVPQIMVLFLLLGFLEECGYMSRIAFLLDKIFRKFGLSGKSFIPILIGTGCGVPGIMASRTIENQRDRRMTVMTTTFIPCSAKLPVIALIAGAMFNGASWVAPMAYFSGIGAIVFSGIVLKKTKAFSGEEAPFVMELPEYHMPKISSVFKSMWDRAWSFVKKAGTVILLSAIVIWFLSNFGFTNGTFGMIADMDNSLLAYIGSAIAFLFIPLGFGNWKAAVATITGLIAKENVVGTFGILYGFTEVSETGNQVWAALQADYTAYAAFGFLMFNLLCAPCVAAIAAIRREMNNSKWTWATIGWQTGVAYAAALIVNQFGRIISGESFSVGTASAIIVVIVMVYLLARPNKNIERK